MGNAVDPRNDRMFFVSDEYDNEKNRKRIEFLMKLTQLLDIYGVDRIYIDRNGSDGTTCDEGTLVFESNNQNLRLAYHVAFSHKPKADHEFWNPKDGFRIAHVRKVPKHVVSVVREMTDEETAEEYIRQDIEITKALSKEED